VRTQDVQRGHLTQDALNVDLAGKTVTSAIHRAVFLCAKEGLKFCFGLIDLGAGPYRSRVQRFLAVCDTPRKVTFV
jgi:hypothetical protein